MFDSDASEETCAKLATLSEEIILAPRHRVEVPAAARGRTTGIGRGAHAMNVEAAVRGRADALGCAPGTRIAIAERMDMERPCVGTAQNRPSQRRVARRSQTGVRHASIAIASMLVACSARPTELIDSPEIVHFQRETDTLGGELFKPKGSGPFPAVLYNHGSAPGLPNSQASKIIGPLFAANGWVFFMPYRRGQGLSEDAGHYIGDEIRDARMRGGREQAAETMTRLLSTEQLQDQLAALKWLKSQGFVRPDRVAVAGNSFGGVEAVLGAANAPYCAVVDASGGAESWDDAPRLRALMTAAVRASRAPIFFFQAENDFNLSPSLLSTAPST